MSYVEVTIRRGPLDVGQRAVETIMDQHTRICDSTTTSCQQQTQNTRDRNKNLQGLLNLWRQLTEFANQARAITGGPE